MIRLEDVQKEGKVVHHTLTEEGHIEFYSIEWPDGVLEENIPANELRLTVLKEHSHGPKTKKNRSKKKKR